MSIIWWALLVIAVFWIIVFYLNRSFDLKKRGITVESGMLMWRTKRGLSFIDSVAKVSKGGWRAFGTAAAIIGFILMVIFFIFLVLNAVIIVQGPEISVPGARFVIPGVTIPLVYGLIALFSVLVVHEFAHGFVMRAQDLRTKSTGVLLFLVIPGAFVEPDEKQLKRAPISKRLRVFGAGPFANILFAFVCLCIVILALSPKPGVYIFDTVENGPSENILLPGDRLLQINDISITITKDFDEFMKTTRENDNLEVSTDRGTHFITLDQHPENENRGYLGVFSISAISRLQFVNPFFAVYYTYEELFRGTPVLHSYCYNAYLPWGFLRLLEWMFFLNLGIGLFNLLPTKPLDGGYIAAGVVERVTSARAARYVSYVLGVVVLFFLIINFVPMIW